jgi:hypothetical protein
MAKRRTRKQGPEQVPAEDLEIHKTLLRKIEDDWLMARIRGDAESTQRLLDETYQGGTSDGLAQTKADFVRFVESSRGPYTCGDHAVRNIQIHGDTAVSTGVVTLRSVNRENPFRYLRVYRKRDGEWRLIASQSARLRST